MEQNKVNSVILLTATVDVRGVSFMQRVDPSVRLKDYERALKWWLSNPHTPELIFCENSGYDLSSLAKICKEQNPYNKKVELFSFDDNNYQRTLGKGYGEIRTIAYALEHSKLINPDTMVFKITGRYYIANIKDMIQSIQRSTKAEIYCNLQNNLTWSDSRIFCASVLFLKKFLLPMQETADDTHGVYIEHVVCRAAHLCMAQGLRWALLPCYLDIRGVSGTSGVTYGSSIFSRIRRFIFHYLKKFILRINA